MVPSRNLQPPVRFSSTFSGGPGETVHSWEERGCQCMVRWMGGHNPTGACVCRGLCWGLRLPLSPRTPVSLLVSSIPVVCMEARMCLASSEEMFLEGQWPESRMWGGGAQRQDPQQWLGWKVPPVVSHVLLVSHGKVCRTHARGVLWGEEGGVRPKSSAHRWPKWAR